MEKGKKNDRSATNWDEANDERGKTKMIDPNKGPKSKRK
ncbi:hypothetical protein J2Z37_004239 [Ammoniphilus resinae]|uniref:Uncharacterized protein n=1 Tax=Ammoniphilus resinae TaxID=861532 RepID=A0ABS4GVC0_9BACL|nr:hypothetical protein [Ammoniphilus resinae]